MDNVSNIPIAYRTRVLLLLKLWLHGTQIYQWHLAAVRVYFSSYRGLTDLRHGRLLTFFVCLGEENYH